MGRQGYHPGMREIVVVWFGRARRDAWEELVADYRERLARHAPVRDLGLRPAPGQGLERLAAEAESLRAALPEPCRVVTLDRRGRAESSTQLAARLGRWWEEWPHAVAFVIGSDLGLHPDLLTAAYRRLSLGPLTLPHALARLVLYEQLYRAFSIRQGIAYHRDPVADPR